LISFKYRSVFIRIDFSFLVFNALIFLVRDSTFILAFYTACAVHEAGHIIALEITGGSIAGIALSGTGIRIDTRRNVLDTCRSGLFVLAAGPAVNLIMYVLFRSCGGAFPVINLTLALYNLLPFRSLDGGAMIALFTVGTSFERTAELILSAIKLLIIAVTLAVVLAI
jgi:Zn-dependent protease